MYYFLTLTTCSPSTWVCFQELPLFPTSTLPKEKRQEEEENTTTTTTTEKTSGSTTITRKNHSHTSPIALPPPPPRPPPPLSTPLHSLSSSSSPSPSSSILPYSSSSSLVHAVSCLPSLLPSSRSDEEKEEDQEVTQVITLTPEQYAALTNGRSPFILQVLPSDATEEAISDANVTGRPAACKRQKTMQLVTKVHESSDKQLTLLKTSGKVTSPTLPPLAQDPPAWTS
ncbi:hypothetical protein GWK47_053413 [Chionoecetes opilio]|uniref:Uncharacterized protein n=1 Tax=Chionoecetes opilio TaxID=41210 RepID=A0A8J4Y638_CHIOP|nr:hypothetical protein GWK47_053413 [Chionoecetes opilio]